MTRRLFVVLLALTLASLTLQAGSAPVRAKRGLVITQSDIASQIGFQVIRDGGNAIDAAVATALAMAVTHPTAGNIGGGGFLVFRPSTGEATTFDFREAAPAGSNPEMWLVNGKYDSQLHHNSHRAVGQACTRRLRAERWSRSIARAHAAAIQEVCGVARAVL